MEKCNNGRFNNTNSELYSELIGQMWCPKAPYNFSFIGNGASALKKYMTVDVKYCDLSILDK
jgi:hypothetical protein